MQKPEIAVDVLKKLTSFYCTASDLDKCPDIVYTLKKVS